jgi:hypothetical protein
MQEYSHIFAAFDSTQSQQDFDFNLNFNQRILRIVLRSNAVGKLGTRA